MRFKNYSQKQFIEAVRTSLSIRQVAIKISLAPYGGNYATIKKGIALLGLDTSHFKGQGWRVDRKFAPKRPIEDYLSNTVNITSHDLRKRLISEGIKEAKCEACALSTWCGKPIPLELDHIDGNSKDNALKNLRILCPNCHAQTPTYRGKNRHNPKRFGASITVTSLRPTMLKNPKKSLNPKSPKKPPTPNYCIDCQKSIYKGSTRCKSCAVKHSRPTKIVWPTVTDLLEMVEATSYTNVGKQLGVSDNAIRKRIRNHSGNA